MLAHFQQTRIFFVAVVVSLRISFTPWAYLTKVLGGDPALNVRSLAQIAYKHETIFFPALIHEHTVSCLMLTFHKAVTNAETFHQLNLLVAIVGLHTVFQTRAGTNISIRVIKKYSRIIVLFYGFDMLFLQKYKFFFCH